MALICFLRAFKYKGYNYIKIYLKALRKPPMASDGYLNLYGSNLKPINILKLDRASNS